MGHLLQSYKSYRLRKVSEQKVWIILLALLAAALGPLACLAAALGPLACLAAAPGPLACLAAVLGPQPD